ncbi:rho GDP-dissociation inhibitor 2-like [Diaphorina citri]|uniref:Rho GDP-dissociation inhibitor 2-like n=1 Tax=Diaphorina citri TaxID=121845 RepID=A0A3Q0JBK8_DIACI|nr:rho GDP-dissociation inhibitor 2-like [Diaphorina citri]
MSGEPAPEIEPVNFDDEEDAKIGYKPPPQKSIEEIIKADKEDESLRKYKETLLGIAKEGAIVVGYI